MKKYLKVLLIFFGIVLVLVFVDVVSIYTNFKPVFALKNDNGVYKGLFYDTYICPAYTVPVVKPKGSKKPCLPEKVVVVDVVNKALLMKDFACAQALELIYEDTENRYYFSCIMSQYIIVKYSNGQTKNIKEALANGDISIEDLGNYGIGFITKSKMTEIK